MFTLKREVTRTGVMFITHKKGETHSYGFSTLLLALQHIYQEKGFKLTVKHL